MPKLRLTSPTPISFEEYCCFDFEWESTSLIDDHSFILAADIEFDFILLDTIGLSNSLSLDLLLESGTKYYWKVESASLEVERSSSFSVIDYVDKYEGSYNATLWEQEWILGTGQGIEFKIDTMYQGNVAIQKSSRAGYLQLTYANTFTTDQIDLKLDPVPNSLGYLYFWDDEGVSPRIYKHGSFYLKQDSLSYISSFSTNGGGGVIKISAKLR